MTTAVLPVAKAVYLCDDVAEDPLSRKVHLVGVLNAVRPQTSLFPFTLKRLCVFAQFAGGIGEMPIHVEVVNAATEKVIYAFPEQRIRFPNRQVTVSTCFRLQDCIFPSAGVYFVELYCQYAFVDDRRLTVLEWEDLP